MSLRESAAVQQRPMRASELKIPDDFVVLEENPDGSVLLGPDTSWEAIKDRHGVQEMSPAEFDKHFGELPTDDEG